MATLSVRSQRELDGVRVSSGDTLQLVGGGPWVLRNKKADPQNPITVTTTSEITGGPFGFKPGGHFGNKAARNNQALMISGCQGVIVEKAYAKRAGHGIRMLSSSHITLRKCRTYENAIEGVIFGGCTYIRLENCLSWGNGTNDTGHAYYGSYGSKHVVFYQCYGWSCKGTFIQCNGTPDELPAHAMQDVLIDQCFGFMCGTSGTPMIDLMSLDGIRIRDTWLINGNAGIAMFNDSVKGADPMNIDIENLFMILPHGKYGLQVSPGTKGLRIGSEEENTLGGVLACASHTPIDGRNADDYPLAKWYGPQPDRGGDSIQPFNTVSDLFVNPNLEKPWLGDWTVKDVTISPKWVPDTSIFKT